MLEHTSVVVVVVPVIPGSGSAAHEYRRHWGPDARRDVDRTTDDVDERVALANVVSAVVVVVFVVVVVVAGNVVGYNAVRVSEMNEQSQRART